MIQEILDYLLIRSLLINSTTEEIIEEIKDKDSFYYIVESIDKLMQEEDFLFVLSEYNEKTLDIVSHYRFDYNKDKELNDKMNYIIGRLKQLREISPERKKYIIDNWLEEEWKNRELPKKYQNIDDIVYLVSLDASYLIGIISLSQMEIKSVIEYSSLINIIINKFPDFFYEDKVLLEVIRKTLISLKKVPFLRFTEAKMLKNTLNKLNENYEITENLNTEVDLLVKKKTKN